MAAVVRGEDKLQIEVPCGFHRRVFVVERQRIAERDLFFGLNRFLKIDASGADDDALLQSIEVNGKQPGIVLNKTGLDSATTTTRPCPRPRTRAREHDFARHDARRGRERTKSP